MKKKTDLRGSFAAKCAAVILLAAAVAGALICCGVVIAQFCGYGVNSDPREDPLLQDSMESAMLSAMNFGLQQDDYYAEELLVRYAGFSARIYDGEPLEENLVCTWAEVPPEDGVWLQRTLVFESTKAASGYYTVAGYLSDMFPNGSVFQRGIQIYSFLRSFDYVGTIIMMVLLTAASLGLLIFLLSAAGHRAHQTGIYPNWLDKIPLDLYLFCAMMLVGFLLAILFSVPLGNWNLNKPFVMYIAPLALFTLGFGAVILATLLTVSTRLKLGKWWRNTICYAVIRWLRKLWRRSWSALTDFIHILPMTWRAVLAVGSILFIQTFLTICTFAASDGAFFFLIILALDAALVVGSAWITRQLQMVQDMGKALAAGDLEVKLDTKKLFWDVKAHAECLNAIGDGMNEAVDRRMRSERLKTELITNVSHDIKTPLTSIVNYVDLLQKETLPPAASEYVAVLDRQSRRLKKLTEDLVEASKASTGNMAVHLEPIVVNEIIHQAVGDYDERLTAGKLEVVVNTYEGNLIALTDGRLLWRVLDNLLSNVCKYAMAGTRVYVDLGTRDGMILLTVKNISRDPLNVSADELMERFVRGDASRHTEGSGLGLNIAKSLMDLMGGMFQISVDGDLFKAELLLNMMEQKPWEKPVELTLTHQHPPEFSIAPLSNLCRKGEDLPGE